MVSVRLDWAELFTDLDELRLELRLSWRQVAREQGVSPSLFTRLSHGQGVSAEVLVRLLLWMGTTDFAPYLLEEL